MKNTLIFILIVSFTLSLAGADGGKIFLTVEGNFLSPADGNYKDIYGSSVIYPGFKIGYKIIKDFYLMAGYEGFSKNGNTPVLDETAKSTQSIISFGIGYWGKLSENAGYRIELGGASFSYKEEAFGETADGSAVGFFLNGGVTQHLGKKFFFSLLLGYSTGSDDVNGVDIKPGGFRASLGIGIKL